MNKKTPGYLTELIPTCNEAHQTNHVVPTISFKHNFFKNMFFPQTIIEWNKLYPSLRNSASYNVFENRILKFIRASLNKIFQFHNPKGIKLVARERVGLNHRLGNKFEHRFQDTLNRLCGCGLGKETAPHYFVHCSLFHVEGSTLMNNIYEIDSTKSKK